MRRTIGILIISVLSSCISTQEPDRFLYAWVMFGRDLSTGVRTKAEAGSVHPRD
jgi:hypothetical protein